MGTLELINVLLPSSMFIMSEELSIKWDFFRLSPETMKDKWDSVFIDVKYGLATCS